MSDDVEVTADKPGSDPSKLPFRTIVGSMTTTQILSFGAFVITVFGFGYSLSEWVENLNYTKQITAKEIEVSSLQRDLKTITLELEEAKSETMSAIELSSNFAQAANRKAASYRAKSEFLNRYLSYLQSPETDGVMHDLLVKHVCRLWHDNKQEIFELRSNQMFLEDFAWRQKPTPKMILALQKVGVTEAILYEYLALDRKVREASGSTEVLKDVVAPNASDYQRHQKLQGELTLRVDKIPISKKVVFFDGSEFDLPPAVATEVHEGSNC